MTRARKVAKPPKKTPDMAAARVVRILREEILERRGGDFLGSEEDLLVRFSVSRPTFRQSARVLEHEQLLTVKRGIGGGYYARKPTIESVERVASTYLRSRHTSLAQLLEAAAPMSLALVKLAARSHDDFARQRLREHFEAGLECNVAALAVADANAYDAEAAALIGALSGNPPLELFFATLYQVGLDETRLWLFNEHPERIASYFERRLEIMRAILASDPEVAEVLQQRSSRELAAWLKDDPRALDLAPAAIRNAN
jgi:DNA-binding FadR family transcriptional regulator